MAVKRVACFILAVTFFFGVAHAAPSNDDVIDFIKNALQSQKEGPPPGVCPKTNHVESCFECHTRPNNRLKETPPGEIYDYPTYGMYASGDTAYYLIREIKSNPIADIFTWVRRHKEIKRVVLEIHSPGGSLFDAYRIVNMMQHMMSNGYVIETRVYGFAASAGFYIFASGSKGYRFAAKNAECMWHELLTFAMFQVSTPSSTEEQSRVLRHLQDTANTWLSEVSNLEKEKIDELIHKKELWLRGNEMVEYGFADKLME